MINFYRKINYGNTKMFIHVNQPEEFQKEISELRFNLLSPMSEANEIIQRHLQCIANALKWKITAGLVQRIQKFLFSGLSEHKAVKNMRLENTDFALRVRFHSKRTKKRFEQHVLDTAGTLKSKGFSYQEISRLSIKRRQILS